MQAAPYNSQIDIGDLGGATECADIGHKAADVAK